MTNKWTFTTIDAISENLDNQRVPVSKLKRSTGSIPYYGATGIVDYVDDHIFDEELLLIGEDGADWSSGANTAFIINGKSWVNNHAHVLRIKASNIAFLMSYLNYSDLRSYTSGTTRGKLNKASLNKIPVPNPPLKVQEKIASIVNSVDENIQKTDQIIQKMNDLKKGLMDELLTKGIGHKKFKETKIGEIPEQWKIVKLEDIASVERGRFSHRPRNDPKFYGGDIPFIQTGDVVNSNGRVKVFSQTLNEQGLKVSKMFPKGIIVMTIAANIGDTGILEFDACFPDSLVGIQPKSSIDPVYLEYFLRSRKQHLNSIATQSAQKNINLAKLNPLLIALPLLSEQLKISAILSESDKKINKELDEKIKLELLKSGLMRDIFTQKVQI